MTAEVERPTLSVVVFGYKNEATIVQAVRSVLEQESDDSFEVVVAVSGNDGSADVVRQQFPGIPVAESPTRLLPGGARNLGLRLAKGEIVAFLEADSLAAPGWVRSRIALHRAGHQAVAGAMSARESDGQAGKAALYLVHPNRLVRHPGGPAQPHQSYWLSFTRALLERAGPFDETLRTDEDTAMVERLHSLGVQPWFDGSVARQHIGPTTIGQMIRDQFARGTLDSWSEILSLPEGRLRQTWEAKPGLRTAIVVLRSLKRSVKRVRWISTQLRRQHVVSIRELIPLLPAMTIGQIAYQAGWGADQLRTVHTGTTSFRRDPLPIPSGIRRRVATNGDRLVVLTFDGDPGGHTRPILDVLRRLGVPATFFVSGSAAQACPEGVRAITLEGHRIGSAGWGDRPFPELRDGELDCDIDRTNALLERLTGQPICHVCPPDGAYDERVVSRLQARGMQIWLWTRHPAGCPPGARPEEVLRQTLGDLTPGAVLRIHHEKSGGDAVVAALPAIITTARRRRYEFVGLDHSSARLS